MDQAGHDALSETHNVLTDLKHFLSVVGTSTNLPTMIDLREIGQRLEAVETRINSMLQREDPHKPDVINSPRLG